MIAGRKSGSESRGGGESEIPCQCECELRMSCASACVCLRVPFYGVLDLGFGIWWEVFWVLWVLGFIAVFAKYSCVWV